jgi:transformation/transcription domain-associated protein
MAYTSQIDSFAERLKEEVDSKTKHSIVSELSDMVEAFSSPTEYEHYLSQFIPIYIDLLNTIPVSFSSSSPDHKLRNSVLEVLHRSQMNETFQAYTLDINDTLQKLLSMENEDNGVLCLKILTSLFKSYKTILTDKAVSFIEIIVEMYKNMDQLVNDTFVNPSTQSYNRPSSPSLPNSEESKQLSHSMHSFKTIAECPITMVTLTSSYKQLVTTSLPDFIPHIIAILQLEVPQQKEARRLSEEQGKRLTAVTPNIRNRPVYGDFILGQVKAASFLAYIFIRGYSQTLLQKYTEIIPDLIMRLLQDCPSELSAARKELLHATRHILTTPHRVLFIPKLHLLFDEKVLIGDGLTVHETLRPLAYSIVADFVHNVRNELSTDEILQTITMYCNHLQDSSLALTVQIMSAKLLLNLVECIMRLNSKSEGRQLFMLIIDAFTKRFKALNRQHDNIMKHHKELESSRISKEKKSLEILKQDNPSQYDADDEINKFLKKIKQFQHKDKKEQSDESKIEEINGASQKDADGDISMEEDNDSTNEKTEGDDKLPKEYDIFDLQKEIPIQIHPNMNNDPLKDARYLFRTLLQFLKTISYGLKNFNPQPPASQNETHNKKWNDLARGFSNEEILVLRQLFRECVAGMRFFSISSQKNQAKPDKQTLEYTGPSLPVSSSKEEKDLMENFAIIFIHIDAATFNEIVQAEVSYLYEAMLKDSALLHIPQFFLANENTSPNFSGLLISFLKEKLDQLGSSDIVKTNILIRLFKLCFMSVNLFPTLNEKVILPHLNDLILKLLKLTTTSKEPIAYFHLIRTLFRSIGGGRFENLYKEIMPLLQVLLESLNRMILTARRPQERDIYVELCLTVPVRLSVLVPHLNYLMRPLVLALNSTQELVSQGLRTLELCVDNLTAEYFDPIIEPVIDDVMKALWKHLKPLPYHHQHSHTTFRILGKLGGRNRRFIKPHQDLDVKDSLSKDITSKFKINGLPEDEASLSLTTGIKEAIDVLENTQAESYYRVSSFKYISRTFLLFIASDKIPENYAGSLAAAAKLISAETLNVEELKILDQSSIHKRQLNQEQELTLRLLKSIFYAISIPELKEEATQMVKNITEHLTLLGVGKVLTEKVKNQRPFLVDDNEGPAIISERIMFEAIIYTLSSYILDVRESGIEAIKVIFDTSVLVFGSKENALEFPILRSLLNAFIHSSYDEAYYNKLASTLGLQTMIQDLDIPISWFKPRQFEFMHAMFYVLRDTNPEAPHEVCDNAKKLILHVLAEANQGVQEAEVFEKPFQTIVGALVYDLSNANPLVRQTSREALKVLSETTKVSISAIIERCKNILLTPIFGKPLRALPFLMQIGNIDAITFCLGLDNSFLTFNDELNRLLMEALTLVDAEDESLTSAHKVSEHRTAEQLVKLRVACIELLSLALTKPEFTSSQQGHTRIRILAVFFKTLCAKSTEIINASHLGLQQVLSQNAKLPKELLQNGLRPMLMNLSDHKKLTVEGLEALARLLELLITYFKVEIGRKLIDHLMAWAHPSTLHTIASEELEHNPTVQVIVAILNIFHLLPPKAYTFMEEIIKTLNYLEDNLRRQQGSPFREPIAKFLNRFSNETSQFFLQHFQNRKMGTKFAYFVSLKECESLRNVTKQNIGAFYSSISTETNSENKSVRFANFVDLISSLADSDPEWMINNKQLLPDVSSFSKEISNIEKSAPLTSPIHFCIRQSMEKLQLLFVKLFEQDPKDSNLIIGLIDLLSSIQIPISPELEDFIFERIVKSQDGDLRQEFLVKSIIFATDNKPLDSRIFVLKNIFNTIIVYEGLRSANGRIDALTSNKAQGSKIPAWLDLVHNRVWRANNDMTQNHTAGSIDNLRLEFLKLSALLLKYAPELTIDLRKDIIKFSWNYIKLDDILTKQAAYVVTSYFISVYETPVKLVTQVFVALLRTHSVDSRHLTRQALDLLAPVMPQRMANDTSPTGWIKWVRRILSENNQVQNLNVYQFLIHHSDVFYIARDHFVPNIITYMGKLTSMANPAAENQSLAIDLAELILNWEIKAKKEADVELVGSSASPVAASNLTEKDEEKLLGPNSTVISDISNSDITTPSNYTVPFLQRDACITFLIRFICVSSQRASENELGQKALHILYKLLSPGYWFEVNVKLQFFEKFLVNADFSSANVLGYCLNALDVLGIALEGKSSQWIVENIEFIQTLLNKCLHSDNHDVQEGLQRVLRIVLRAITKEGGTDEKTQTEEVKTFLTLLSSIVAEDLQNTNSVAAGVTLAWTLANHYPKSLDPLIQSIIRTFAKICKDHISISQTDTSSPQAEFEAKMTTNLLGKILYISSMRISTLSDQRRIFLTLLAQLIDRSLDIKLLGNIIDIVRSWVFSIPDLFPTTKEKAAILIKMLVFELRGELSLSKEFYQIIVDIFEDKSMACTELTVRMEQPFLVGTRLADVGIRTRLMSILNESLEKDINKRLNYVIREQNWEYLADYTWLNQALQLFYGSFDYDHKLKLESCYRFSPLDQVNSIIGDTVAEAHEGTLDLIERQNAFLKETTEIKAGDILKPLIDLFYKSPEVVHKTWVDVFPVVFTSISRRETQSFKEALVLLLSKDYHTRQAESRPNVVQSLLEGIGRCPGLQLPPHLIKYLGYTFDAWYPSIKIMEAIEEHPFVENSVVRETNQDALVEMYASLQEDDMFYGQWRRRAKYQETNAALSCEQIGLWDKALQLYEAAQIKARSGALPYGESEYSLWEDNWILCAEKLQHWDILTELAKHEGFTDLLLECGWRVADWTADKEPLEQSVKTVMDVPTPRRRIFETFLCLQGYSQQKETLQDLSKLCDEGIQLALNKWHALPSRFTNAHVPLLHSFQQYVEFMEASQVYGSLLTTNAQNLDNKSQELKRVLQAWRERLPNVWDDINIWNDLVTWRQHAFGVVNKVYMPFIPALQQANGNSNVSSYAYRGYHEIAWVINRFAHVARKHNMPDVCINQLTKIYTLPNIEIQEAFLKLREQAKCHYQNPNELNTGLDVISNTNLVYFATQQKAEFFTLKGMFLAKLKAQDEANQAFATAVQIDLNLAKAWAEWGHFNDRRLKEAPNEIVYANNAISCFLQAAGLYKNGKSRSLLCRILWLISLDDKNGSISQAFESYRGEVPVWYWITFIPQLLTSLSHKEAKLVRQILIRIAKTYPQALHFQLRTTKEDFAVIQKQAMAVANRQNGAQQSGTPQPQTNSQTQSAQPGAQEQASSQAQTSEQSQGSPQLQNGQQQQVKPTQSPNGIRQPWEYVDEIMGILKTAYPLLALSLESLVDQINHRFKCSADEDAYRLVTALLNDGIQYSNRLANPREDAKLPPTTEANITRFAETVLPKHIRAEFVKDFISSKPNLQTYISKLRNWRDRLEDKLDRRFSSVNLESVCPHLSEFHHQKFEDIEVPGQYLLNKDNNSHFIKIERFLPTLELIRGTFACYKRIKIRGHDGSLHQFAVQFPAARHCRREERIFQLYRIFNDTLSKKVQTRKRNIQFTLPIAVPLSPQIRIMDDTSSLSSLHEIYEDYCKTKNLNRDEPLIYFNEKMRAAFDPHLPKPDIMNIRVEIFSAIQSLIVPNTVVKNYFTNLYTKFEDFWLFRKQFTSQYASFIFMTYMMSIAGRQPYKISINEKSGAVTTFEMLPSKIASSKANSNFFANSTLDVPAQRAAPIFYNAESVPFRLTPNIQQLIGEAGLEGILSVHILCIAKALTEPESELTTHLPLFVRDETISWFTQQHRPSAEETQLREIVRVNVELISKKVQQISSHNGNSVATQNILDFIQQAVNPRNLAACDTLWMAYL